MMKRIAAVLAMGVVGALALTACSGASQEQRDEVVRETLTQPGVNDATVETVHSGAPWNSDTVIWLYLSDVAPDAVAGVARFVVTRIHEQGGSWGDLSFFVVEGSRGDFASSSDAKAARVFTLGTVAEKLGVEPRNADMLTIRRADIAKVARGE